MREQSIRSFDGTRIAYRVSGGGQPWVVIANGYGGTFCAWDDVIARLSDRYRFLVWDYRGLHRSERPSDMSRLTILDHCRDLDAIREAEGIETMAMAAWSVGCQVALEQYRRNPESVEALLLINGAQGQVLRRSLPGRVQRGAATATLRGLRALAPAMPAALAPLRLLVHSPVAGTLLRRTGLFNGSSDSLTESARAILRLDYRIYSHMILLADAHDADDVLTQVKVPALVVAGNRDAITSTALSRSIADRIPGALYREVSGATHYGLMEFPHIYADHMAEALELGFEAKSRP